MNVLGFKIDWEAAGIIASVSRGRCGIFLCEGDQGHPGDMRGDLWEKNPAGGWTRVELHS